MLGNHGRSVSQFIFTPVARLLLKMRVTPNMVTIAGTVVVVTLSVGLLARGYLGIGGLVLTLVMFTDSVDGILARLSNNSTRYGAFLDSTMDRIADGAVFGALLWWAIVGLPDSATRSISIISGIVCMTVIGVVPYVRAKAEAFGIIAKVGIAERTDRLIMVLIGCVFTDFGLPIWCYAAGLTLVAVTSIITITQRILVTRRELLLTESDI